MAIPGLREFSIIELFEEENCNLPAEIAGKK